MTGWRKASGCVTNACVWVDIRPDGVVRISHRPIVAGTGAYPILHFSHDEWADFLEGVRAGEFDL